MELEQSWRCCNVYCRCSGAEHIRRGEADLMLAGGADAAIIPTGIGGFVACKALSKRNDSPETASRPWDKARDGFVMGEGAGDDSISADRPLCFWRPGV